MTSSWSWTYTPVVVVIRCWLAVVLVSTKSHTPAISNEIADSQPPTIGHKVSHSQPVRISDEAVPDSEAVAPGGYAAHFYPTATARGGGSGAGPWIEAPPPASTATAWLT